jgi:hypothetical protein
MKMIPTRISNRNPNTIVLFAILVVGLMIGIMFSSSSKNSNNTNNNNYASYEADKAVPCNLKQLNDDTIVIAKLEREIETLRKERSSGGGKLPTTSHEKLSPCPEEAVIPGVEQHYNEEYQKWQLASNQLGVVLKRYLHAPHTRPDMICAEFGGSSGAILASMNCKKKILIELNPAARKFAIDNYGLEAHARTCSIPSNSLDYVLTTSVLEHVECPICECREIHRVLKPGATFVVTVPGMAPTSMSWRPKDINNELQMFGALELGNILVGAGFEVMDCNSKVLQWGPESVRIEETQGTEARLKYDHEQAIMGNQLVTTHCVGRKK